LAHIYDILESNPIIGALPHMVLPNEKELEKVEVFFLLSYTSQMNLNNIYALYDTAYALFYLKIWA
jgi:hypothetical protein